MRKTLSSLAIWFLMLTKRLFMRKSFIALLLLIPALGGLMALASEEESGVETVILVAEGGEGEISHKIVDRFMAEDSIVNFKQTESAADAIEQVEYGRADSAWILPAGLDKTLSEYAADVTKDVTLATVYQSKETPIIRVLREKLNGAIFKYVAAALYDEYYLKVKEVLPDAEYGEFEQYLHDSAFKESIVNFEYIGTAAENVKSENYLTSPVRGLAALASLLCTLAAALYSMQDEKSGFFLRIPLKRRLPLLFASNLAASLVSSAVMVVSLVLCGSFTSALYEIPAALAFAVASASFCTLMCRLFSGPFALGSAIPPAVIASAVLCPIFITVRFSFRPDLYFPITYALRAVRAPRFLAYAVIYSAVCMALAWALDRIKILRNRL